MRFRSIALRVLTVLITPVPLFTHGAEVLVHLQNPPEEGRLVLELFDSPNAFGDLRDPIRTEAHPLDKPSDYVLKDIPPGEYALLAYYDTNGNDRIDKNFIGIPREPLGFSNQYRPKGPPSYARAAFTLNEGEIKQFDVALYRPLGKRGRFGIGPGLIWRSSPYRDYDGGIYRFIPAITYTGDRLQWFGPRAQFGLAGSGHWRLAATGEYRMGAYEEDGSDYLAGMGDAESTFMAGLAMQVELPGGIDLSLGGSADALNRIGGTAASAAADKSFHFGLLRISPRVALNWLDDRMAANDYGVPQSRATATRPAYEPGDTIGMEGGVVLFLEITTDWLFVGSTGVEWLDSKATDSPIVDKDYVIKGYSGVNYVF